MRRSSRLPRCWTSVTSAEAGTASDANRTTSCDDAAAWEYTARAPKPTATTSAASATTVAMPALLNLTLRGVARRSCGGSTVLFSLALLLRTCGLRFRAFLRAGRPSGIPQRTPQEVLDLSVHTAEFSCGPSLQLVIELRIEPERESLSFGHPTDTACRCSRRARPLFRCTTPREDC